MRRNLIIVAVIGLCVLAVYIGARFNGGRTTNPSPSPSIIAAAPGDQTTPPSPARLFAQTIRNQQVSWNGTFVGLMPRLGDDVYNGFKAVENDPHLFDELYAALQDTDRFIIAHVLLCRRYGDLLGFSAVEWNGLRIALHSDGTFKYVSFDASAIIRRWAGRRSAIMAETAAAPPANMPEPIVKDTPPTAPDPDRLAKRQARAVRRISSYLNDPNTKATIAHLLEVVEGKEPFDEKKSKSSESVYGCRVLRTGEVSAATYQDMVKAVTDPASYSDKYTACFMPGLHVELKAGDDTLDLMICLECRYLYIRFSDGGWQHLALSEDGRKAMAGVLSSVFPEAKPGVDKLLESEK